MSSSRTSDSRRVEDEEARPYVITSEIGKGSFATVYRGYHSKARYAVAIKTVSRSILTTKLIENLESEISILKQLKHPHITELKDIVKAEKNIYLIMEFCSGGDLSQYIRARGRIESLQYSPRPGDAPIFYPHPKTGGLEHKAVRCFLTQLARALKFLRERNLIHRDIKPQNLLLQPASDADIHAGHPVGIPLLKVADFGFARVLPNATMAETLCGSPLYMAPEILRYEKYNAKADLWSVGAVLYEMSVGKPPFRAQNHIELLKRIEHARNRVNFPDEDPEKMKTGQVTLVPDDIKKLIRMLLKKSSVERASFEEFFASDALRDALSDDVGPSSASASPARANAQLPPVSGPSIAAPVPSIIPPATDLPFKAPKRESWTNGSENNEQVPNLPFQRRQSRDKDRERDKDRGKEREDTAHPSKHSPRTPKQDLPATTKDNGRSPDLERLIRESSIHSHSVDEEHLRRDYVLVDDTQAVEFHRIVDEIGSVRKKPIINKDRPTHHRVTTFPRTPNPLNININEETARPTFQTSRSDPEPASTSSRRSETTFPPPQPDSSKPLDGSPGKAPTSALARAINIASKKLFGTPVPRSPSARRLPIIPAIEDTIGLNPDEDELLAYLEDMAQKSQVLVEWSDQKYAKLESSAKPLADPQLFARRKGEKSEEANQRRRRELEAENNAVHCIALYIAAMGFSQKAITTVNEFLHDRSARGEDAAYSSPGLDDALLWFSETFKKCVNRANIVKAWLPEGYSKPHMWIDRVIYDHALALMRNAAGRELLEENFQQCEHDYETALWMLYAIADDVIQKDNPFAEQDRKTIGNFIETTKLRLKKLRERLAARVDAATSDNGVVLSQPPFARSQAPPSPTVPTSPNAP